MYRTLFRHRLAIVALSLGVTLADVHAGETADPAGAFAIGVAAFNAGRFDAAMESFEAASAAMPQNAEYQHWLGRAYGRLAEQSSWLAAMDLARKTCAAFERAYALDPNDAATIEDLIEYYTEAPPFLGGSPEKAEAMKRRLETLKQGGAQTVAAEPPQVNPVQSR